jgi:hypothetical protein
MAIKSPLFLVIEVIKEPSSFMTYFFPKTSTHQAFSCQIVVKVLSGLHPLLT